jgi:polyphosphate kinase
MDEELISDFDRNDLYLNRELGLLAFQERVFGEAQDEKNPLLERVKFLGILGSNLDEFFMVRFGGLKMQHDAGVVDFSIDGQDPAEQLASIRKTAPALMIEARKLFHEILKPKLDKAGIHVLTYDELTQKQKGQVKDYFNEVIFPVLTPLAFDPGHPFPHISNLSLNLAIVIRDQQKKEYFARLKVPASLPRLLPIKRSSGSVKRDGTVPHNHYFVWIEEVICAHLEALFPGMHVVESYPFRVIRNADMEVQEMEAGDLLETIEESILKRRFGDVVQLTLSNETPEHIRMILVENLQMDPRDVYIVDNPLGLSHLLQLHEIDRYDLKDPPFIPAVPQVLRSDSSDGSLFKAIRENDVLLHHPYDSFSPVIEFFKRAARDPGVLAIKQTLYRVGNQSPIVNQLLEARRDYGKQIAVLVELKARFDETSNIGWARMLEREGVHVIYGLVGLKTHCKVAMVVRKEEDHIRRYIHLGTGNYNQVTARLYEDMGLFTCDPEIGADVTDLFNYLTGYSARTEFRKLLVAPLNMRARLNQLIDREIEHQKSGKQGYMILKTNSLVDRPIIQKLYKASQAGVQVDLLVRGICSLRPGIPGLSENIRVRSILGRFLEHSRVYYFQNDGDEEIFAGSADLMPRNLNHRVEVLFPIEDQVHIRYLRDEVLATYLADNVKARQMQPDGSYILIKRRGKQAALNSQLAFLGHRSNNRK